jgi:signal transduction histidine kinase
MRRVRASTSIAALWVVPLIAALLFAVAGLLSYLWIQRSVQASAGETLQTVLRADVEAMTFWLELQTTAIESTARLPEIAAASAELMAQRDADAAALRRAPAAARFAAQVEGSTKTLHLAGFALLDPNGRVLASSLPALVGTQTTADLELLARAAAGATVLAPPRVYPHDQQPYLSVLTRLPCDAWKPCGVLRFRLRPEADFTRILNVARFGLSGETYAFDDHARFVSESRFVDTLARGGLLSRAQGTAVLSMEIRDPGGDVTRGYRPTVAREAQPLTRMAADAVTGRSGLDLQGYRDYRGVTVVGAWTWLPAYGIGLATEVDRSEAYATATVMRRALYLPFALLIGTSVVAFVLSHKARALRSSLVQSEHEVHQRDALIKAVFDGMADAVMVADHKGRMLFTNPAVARITGVGRTTEPPHRWAEEYGAYLPDKVTPFPTTQLPLVRTLRGETVDNVLMFVRNPKKPEGAFINISGRPLRDEDGEITGGSIVYHDVTAERNAEEAIRGLNLELKHNNAELSALNKELEAFSYSVSHDLRAPLRHINGFVDLLQKRVGPGLDDTARRHLSIVADSARRMGALIDDLLAFSRMSRSDMHHAPVDLNGLVREVIVEAARDAEQREIEWVVASLPSVLGDRAMLRLALLNLLANAVKYTRQQPHARIEIGNGGERDGFVELFVRDNGVGFDMQYADKLFGVFQRLHRADEFEGTGIGLATVRRIVHRHGGRTWAEAKPNAGATFYCTLPVNGD